ncbi:MAG: DMT family transporter [Planctomycetia bacterium]
MPHHLDHGMLSVGIAAGFAAALCSAVSYFISRDHGSRGGSSLRLLVLAHGMMGVACLPLSWLLWPTVLGADTRWAWPLAGTTASYLLGQVLVFSALCRTGASRVAPLLGLKIAMLAGITCLTPGGALDIRQWIAVGMSVVAAVMLQRGGGMPLPAVALTLGACLTFAMSDLYIVALIDGLQESATAAGQPLGRLAAGGLAMAVTYVACGAVAVGLASHPGARPTNRDDWLASGRYSVAWLAGMVGLYTCFGTVGAVFGNILQSTRGVIAIAIGALLAHRGRHDLEMQVDRATFLRRVAAAILMTAAIALYVVDLS